MTDDLPAPLVLTADQESFRERFRHQWNVFHGHGRSTDPNPERCVSAALLRMAEMIESDRELGPVEGEELCESPIEVHFMRYYRLYAADHRVEPQAKLLRFRADFLINGEVVVECDGDEFHRATGKQIAVDAQRDQEMTDAGYKVFRFRGADIMRDPLECCRQVAMFLEGL